RASSGRARKLSLRGHPSPRVAVAACEPRLAGDAGSARGGACENRSRRHFDVPSRTRAGLGWGPDGPCPPDPRWLNSIVFRGLTSFLAWTSPPRPPTDGGLI